MDDDRGALDVFEELDAETVAEVCAFNETGEIGYCEGFGVGEVADLDYAEVGFEGGEGVVGDLWLSRGEAGDEGRLADIGVAYEACIGKETEFEAVAALFACAAKFVLAGGLVGGCREVLVAAASASTAGDDNGFVGASEVVDEFAGLVVVEEGADRNFVGGGFCGGAGHVGAETVATALGLVLGVEAEVDEGVVRERGGHEEVATMASVASGWASTRDEFFAPEGHATVAAVPGFYANFGFVNKHFPLSSVAEAA